MVSVPYLVLNRLNLVARVVRGMQGSTLQRAVIDGASEERQVARQFVRHKQQSTRRFTFSILPSVHCI